MQSDLLYDLLVNPDKKKLINEINKGNALLPKEMDKEMMWTTVMKTKSTIRTVDDAHYYIFVLLVGCPAYYHYMYERSNKIALLEFMSHLKTAFDTLNQGRARDGSKAEHADQKKYVDTIDFVYDMRSLYTRL